MTGCSVRGCYNSTKNGCAMKILPRKNVPREKWIKSISRSKWSPDEYTYCVCEEHYSAYKAVTLCCDGKQDFDSCAVSTIEPQPNSPTTNNKMESTNSNASDSSTQLQNVRIKHLKNNEASLSDSESTEFEVIEEIEYEVMEEEEEDDDCAQSSDKDSEKIMIAEIKEELIQVKEEKLAEVGDEDNSSDQEIKEESMNNCELNFNKDQEKIRDVCNSLSKHSKNVTNSTEKLLKNQENLTLNTDDSSQSDRDCSRLLEYFSDSSQNSNYNEKKLFESQRLLNFKNENSSVTYTNSNKNKTKLIKSQGSDKNIKLHSNKILLIKKESKITQKQESSINPDDEESLQSTNKFHLSGGNLIYDSKEKLHQELENTIKQNIKSIQSLKKDLTLYQSEKKCEENVNEKQGNSIKNQESTRIVPNSVANLQNKLFLVVKPEKLPQNQETLPQNYARLNKNQPNCNMSSDKILKNQVILIKNENNTQEAPVISKVNGTNPVKNQVFLIKNPPKVPEAQENLKQTGVNLVNNQLFLILKQNAPLQNEQTSDKIRQEKPQIQNYTVQSQDNPDGNKRKLRSMTKKETESNKRVCTDDDKEKLPTRSEKLIENRRKLSQYLQYLNEASKTVAEYKKSMIKQTASVETVKNDKNTVEEKTNEIDDDPFSTNDPEQFSMVNTSVSTSMSTCNNGTINDNNCSNNDHSSSSSSNNNNDININNNNKNSNDKDKITYMNQLIEKQQQLLRVYRNKLGFARYKIKDQEAKLELWRTMMETIFNEDQISYLEAIQSQKKRCKCWSAATIKDAIDIKNIVGTVGYEELLRRKYPFPALRTLREKTQKSKEDE
ncbi:myb-like protein D isoform X1 [Cotesia glomerata]|uniref:myb-like protein D isoform X1 n=2 Tax=Cotesia glomerata TaxID=32391 RepID=UPI001D035727|nr:myb-like protein D isoform X1 [Cotesia glomerata]